MDEDEGKLLIFDEVDAQEVVEAWAETYAEGVELVRWYFDCHRQVFVIGIHVDGMEDGDDLERDKEVDALSEWGSADD
jgi:hypothetical protein